VCKSKYIGNSKGIIKTTYSDGRKYVASIIAKNGVIFFDFVLCNIYIYIYHRQKKNFFIIIDDKNMLLKLKQNIINNKPYILCKKLNFYNGNTKKPDKINKSCDKSDRISKNDKNANNIIFNGKCT